MNPLTTLTRRSATADATRPSRRPSRRLGGRLAAAAGVVLLLAACSSTTEASEEPAAASSSSAADSDATRTVETAYGEVEVPVAPQRVVAVSYDTPWQLQAVGITPVAVQDYSAYEGQFPAEQAAFVEGIPVVGSFFELNVEAVLAAEPDLIVGDVLEIDEETFARLSAIAPTAIYEGEYRGDWRAISAGVADAVNASSELDEAHAAYDAALADITTTYADTLTGLQWAAIGDGDVEGGFSVLFPSGAVGALIFEDLGATVAPGAPAGNDKGWEYVSPELTATVLGEADIIIAGAAPSGELTPGLQQTVATPLFTALPAQQAGAVYPVFSSVTDYGTALRWLETMETTVLEPHSAR